MSLTGVTYTISANFFQILILAINGPKLHFDRAFKFGLGLLVRFNSKKEIKSVKWSLWKFQAMFNNTRSSATEKTLNELMYGFTRAQPLDLLGEQDLLDQRRLCKEAADAIAWAQIVNKAIYDRKHTPLFLKVGEWAVLRLHHGLHPPTSAWSNG